LIRPESTVGSPLRILLADDNPAILEVVKRMLQDDFVVVAAVTDASSVLQQVPDLEPDIIILDISMNDLNGFEVTRRLKATPCKSKIIFLTVHEDFEFVRAAFDSGASGYVFKSRLNTDLRPAIQAVQLGKAFLPDVPLSQ
jgi:DNA-binding NarL/FixJ family response regulator